MVSGKTLDSPLPAIRDSMTGGGGLPGAEHLQGAWTRRELVGGLGAWAVASLVSPAARAAKAPFAELRLRGSAGAIGHGHGKRFARQVAHNVGFYLRWLDEHVGLAKDRALAIARGFAPVLAEHTPELLEEIKGIARGAGRDEAEILLLNARTDMLVLGRRKRAERKGAHPGCTALALVGRRSGRRVLALGQNWDWRPALAGNVVVLRIHRRGAPALVTLTEAGMVGKIGFNEHRVGVCLNFLAHASDSPRRPHGVPVHVLLRSVMECSSLSQAADKVTRLPRCASANFLIAQHEKGALSALDLELTPTTVGKLPLERGALVHTNHFLDKPLVAGCKGRGGRSTENRYEVARALVKRLRRLRDPVARMRRILRDRRGAPYSVSRSPARDAPSTTLASVIMDLSGDRLYLCAGAPHRGSYVRRPGV